MALTGKLSTELGIQAATAKFFNLYSKRINQVQNLTERVHETKLLQGDWHSIGSARQWIYSTIDGKVTTSRENIEVIDEPNKSITFNLFDGDISQRYKLFKLNLQVIDKNDGGAVVKWTVEYEKVNKDIKPPYGFLDILNMGY